MPRFQREFVVEHAAGLHARPAALFVRTASQFESQLRLANLAHEPSDVNAKSILEVLTAGVESGQRIRITADGDDAEAALDALGELITSNFETPPPGGPKT